MQAPPRTRKTPPLPCRPTGRDGHCSRRYASYWNAFLFKRLRYRPSQNEIYSQVHCTPHGRVKHVRLNFFTPNCLILTSLDILTILPCSATLLLLRDITQWEIRFCLFMSRTHINRSCHFLLISTQDNNYFNFARRLNFPSLCNAVSFSVVNAFVPCHSKVQSFFSFFSKHKLLFNFLSSF